MTTVNLCEQVNAMNDVLVEQNFAGKNIEAFPIKCVDQRRVSVFVQPSTSTPTNALNGSQIDYQIQNSIDRIMAMTLKITINNSSGSQAAISSNIALIQQIQIYSNNGATLLYQTLSEQENWIFNNMSMPREEWELSSPLFGSNANYGYAVQTINTGVTEDYYIPICRHFWKSTKLRPYTFNGNLLIRVKFNPIASTVVTGTITTPSVTLKIDGFMESPAQKKMQIAKALLPKQLFFYGIQRDYQTLNLSPSTTYTIKLSGILGYINVLAFAIQASTNLGVPAAQFTFAAPYSFELLNDGNENIVGFNPITVSGQGGLGDDDLSYAQLFPNLFSDFTGAVIWSFSQTPQVDFLSGSQCNGFVPYNGFYSLKFTTTSSLTSGSYQILTMGSSSEYLRIVNGNMTSSRS